MSGDSINVTVSTPAPVVVIPTTAAAAVVQLSTGQGPAGPKGDKGDPGAGAAPGGTQGQLQANIGGAFAGMDCFYWDPVTQIVTCGSLTNINPSFQMHPLVAQFGFFASQFSTYINQFGQQGGGLLGFQAGSTALDDDTVAKGATFTLNQGIAGNGGGDFDVTAGDSYSPTAGANGGQVSIAAGTGAGALGGQSGNVNVSAGNVLVDAPVGLTVLDGGAGYLDGVWIATGANQTFNMAAFESDDTGFFGSATFTKITVVGGAVVSFVIGKSFGPSIVGGILELFVFTPPTYPVDAPQPTRNATFSVTAVASSAGGGQLNLNTFGGSISIGVNGELLLQGNPGNPGQVPNSAGTGFPVTWRDAGRPVISRDAINDGDTFNIQPGTTIESLQATSDYAALTVGLPASPLPDFIIYIVCNANVAAVTFIGQSGESASNAVGALVAGVKAGFIYNADTNTWEGYN